ncbi:MAG: hypothetical protein AB1772_07390 [Candidatus Zixiibacteriota bacterium]
MIGLLPFKSLASAGSGTVKAGYLFTDEVGDRALNQETFNVYSGMGLSLERFSFQFQNGVRVTSDLTDLTLNNRNLTFGIEKTGKFRLDLHNDQYRRFYDFEGGRFTRRRTTSAQLSVRPIREVELYGGVYLIDRHGDYQDALAVTRGIAPMDFRYSTVTTGAHVAHRGRNIDVSYQRFKLTQEIQSDPSQVDRTADAFRFDASTPVPKLDQVSLSGGYQYRKDYGDLPGEIKTNLGWGAARWDLPRDYQLEYRLVFARTDQTTLDRETDNATNTVTIGKLWRTGYGIRVGYENRIADDLTNRTEAHGLLVSTWGRIGARFTAKASASFLDKDVVDGTTLTGDQSSSRFKISGRYSVPEYGDLCVQWSSRVTTHDPVPVLRDSAGYESTETRVDYQVWSTVANIKVKRLGSVNVSYAYYVGEYQNNSRGVNYEFSDHIVQGSVHPRRYENIEVSARGVYYRSRRDQNAEKFSVGFDAAYFLKDDYVLGASYDAFNADDLLFVGQYYTANIVRVYIARNVTF